MGGERREGVGEKKKRKKKKEKHTTTDVGKEKRRRSGKVVKKKKGELTILHHLPYLFSYFWMVFQPLYHFSIYRKILLFLITV